MTARVVETRMGDPTETRADLSLPDLDFGGVMPDDVPDFDAPIVHSPNGNGQHAPAIDDQFFRLTSHLWRGGAFAYFWTHPDKLSRWFEVGKPLPPIPNGRCNIYFGVHPIGHQKTTTERSTIAEITAINGLFAEFDVKDFGGDWKALNAHLAAIPIQPSVIIFSGGGLHCYWLLRQTCEIHSDAEREFAQHLQADWVSFVGSDVDAKDLARVLRVPGTRNYKPDYAPNFPRVEFVKADFDLLYELCDFDDLLTEVEHKPQAEPSSGAQPTGSKITKGTRNSTLASLAGSMRRRGMTPDAIEAALSAENQARCDPPLPESEVKVIARSVARYEPKPLTEPCELTDMGNARRFAVRCGHVVKYAKAWGWLFWNGQCWQRDDVGMVRRLGRDTVRAIHSEAQFAANEDTAKKIGKWAVTSQSRQHLKDMIELAESEPEIITTPDQFDRDAMLFNVQNGTLDLRTGELRPHDPADLITKIAGAEFDPDATCPIWLGFLNRIMAGKASLKEFLRRAIGYSLSGDTSEQVLFFNYGTGANGKSVLLETLRAALGDYGQAAEFSTFLMRQSDNIRNDIARLAGARFVSAIEAGEGRRLSEVLVKSLIGSDTVTARFLHREFFEFRPRFKLWLAANHKPVIRGTDYAIWRRIRLIPFIVTIPEQERDPHLADKLRGELPGILAWAVRGCLDWQREGLGTPDEVREATEAYRLEMDTLAAFLDECCVIADGAKVAPSDLYGAFKSWCDANGEQPGRQRDFRQRMIERGFQQERTGKARRWEGIGLPAK